MDWASPRLLWLIPPAILLLGWASVRSGHPMSLRRRRALFGIRSLAAVLTIVALAGPAWERTTEEQAVVLVLDHSDSQGAEGLARARARAEALSRALPPDASLGIVSAGERAELVRAPSAERGEVVLPEGLAERGAESDLAAAVRLSFGLFPAGTARRIVLLTDGLETRGDLLEAAREAALKGIAIDCVPLAGAARPDVRIARLRSDRSRSHEGAAVALTAEVEGSLEGPALVRLFENGVEVDRREVALERGAPVAVRFVRTPEREGLYRFLARVEATEGGPVAGDAIPENDEALALVDVRGRPLLLYVEGEDGEADYLARAMAIEGIQLDVRPPDGLPKSLAELAGYDGLIVSDVPAAALGERTMDLVHDYVEKLGGGFLMVGGVNAFGVGGYYRTPIEDILPVKLKAPDTEERFSVALCLVIDRSGSMQGAKIEICKSAAVGTADLLQAKDQIGVIAFDSQAHWVVPMMSAGQKGEIRSRVATIHAGGGTNIYPGMTAGHEALRGAKAKVKHMIVLTDGQTTGGGYEALSAQMHTEGITISTVAVGAGAAQALLQSIAKAGGGKYYETQDPSQIPRIFTQDTMVHAGRLVREDAFKPQQVEEHPMLAGWPAAEAPPLLGYVKTTRKATAQVPLVTDQGDPLLAHWRFGLGKVTAFTSDCKSRWSALWLAGWGGYGQFWGQVLREMGREPEGRHMDIQVEERGDVATISIDVLEDAARFRNAADVRAEVFFVPQGGLGQAMREVVSLGLDQVGPGRYEGRFRPEEPGVYLVRARSGAGLVSAGLVRNPSSESATGRVDEALLEKVAKLTGGAILSEGAEVAATRAGHARYEDLVPWLVRLLLALFLCDLVVRRWENVLGLYDWTLGRLVAR